MKKYKSEKKLTLEGEGKIQSRKNKMNSKREEKNNTSLRKKSMYKNNKEHRKNITYRKVYSSQHPVKYQ